MAVGRSSGDLEHRLEVEVASPWNGPPTDPALDAYRKPRPDDWDPGVDAFEALLGHAVPDPIPMRPFTRDTTLNELATSPLGKPVTKVVRAVVGRLTGGSGSGGDEGGLAVMVDRALGELPLRNLAVMSQGRVPMAAIDRLVALANRTSRRTRKRV